MKSAKKPAKQKECLRVFQPGDLVYLKDPGYPYNRTDDGGEDWTGASAVVVSTNAGYSKDMVEVKLLLPIRTDGSGKTMTGSLFHPSALMHEDRPWLKAHLKPLLEQRNHLLAIADEFRRSLPD